MHLATIKLISSLLSLANLNNIPVGCEFSNWFGRHGTVWSNQHYLVFILWYLVNKATSSWCSKALYEIEKKHSSHVITLASQVRRVLTLESLRILLKSKGRVASFVMDSNANCIAGIYPDKLRSPPWETSIPSWRISFAAFILSSIKSTAMNLVIMMTKYRPRLYAVKIK